MSVAIEKMPRTLPSSSKLGRYEKWKKPCSLPAAPVES
jgi:hypothetical protein